MGERRKSQPSKPVLLLNVFETIRTATLILNFDPLLAHFLQLPLSLFYLSIFVLSHVCTYIRNWIQNACTQRYSLSSVAVVKFHGHRCFQLFLLCVCEQCDKMLLFLYLSICFSGRLMLRCISGPFRLVTFNTGGEQTFRS